MATCPVCGASSDLIEHAVGGGGGSWVQQASATFGSSAMSSLPDSGATRQALEGAGASEWEWRRPVRAAQTSDVIVVGMWAAGTFLVLLIAGALLALLSGQWAWLLRGVGLGLVGMVGLWIVLLWDSQRQLWQVDRIKRGVPAAERSKVVTEKVEVTLSDPHREPGDPVLQVFELPISREKLESVARAVLKGGARFSRPCLCDERGILSQAEYHAFARVLGARGHLHQVGSSNKRVLSRGGLALLESVLAVVVCCCLLTGTANRLIG